MTQCYYKIHREDPKTFPKIDAMPTSERNSPGIFQCYGDTLQTFIIIKHFKLFSAKQNKKYTAKYTLNFCQECYLNT